MSSSNLAPIEINDASRHPSLCKVWVISCYSTKWERKDDKLHRFTWHSTDSLISKWVTCQLDYIVGHLSKRWKAGFWSTQRCKLQRLWHDIKDGAMGMISLNHADHSGLEEIRGDPLTTKVYESTLRQVASFPALGATLVNPLINKILWYQTLLAESMLPAKQVLSGLGRTSSGLWHGVHDEDNESVATNIVHWHSLYIKL